MRQADINRVKKAREHLKAAVTVLASIKWVNISEAEHSFKMQGVESIQDADWHLQDILNLPENKE